MVYYVYCIILYLLWLFVSLMNMYVPFCDSCGDTQLYSTKQYNIHLSVLIAWKMRPFLNIYSHTHVYIYNLQLFTAMRQALTTVVSSQNRMTESQKLTQPGNPQDSPPIVAALAQRLQGTCRFHRAFSRLAALTWPWGWPWGSDWWVLKLISYIITYNIYKYNVFELYVYII